MKKFLKAAIMLAVLVVFVSCQEKKETPKDSMKKYDNVKKERPTFRDRKCNTCPKDKGSSESDAASPQEEQDSLSQDIKIDESLPLEEFKASIHQDITSEITEVEEQNLDIQE